MASKEREYFDRQRRQFRSPVELQKVVDARYGADAALKMGYREAHDIYDESIKWSSRNDMPMQDFWAYSCRDVYLFDETDPGPVVQQVVEALKAMSEHLSHGQELGLSALEQRVVDTLWGWVPHDYEEDYVACAREVSEAIERLLPPDSAERTEEGYGAYYRDVIAEVRRLAAKHDVEFDSASSDKDSGSWEYNIKAGYLYDWLKGEYGLVEDADWDSEC